MSRPAHHRPQLERRVNRAPGFSHAMRSSNAKEHHINDQQQLPFGGHLGIRWLVFAIGVFVMSLGIALSVRAQLGTSPISTLPTVLSAATSWTLGQYTIAMNIGFFLLSLLIQRRRFPLVQFTQLPIAVLFGLLCDVSLHLLSGVNPTHYVQQWAWTLLGAIVLGVGVFIEITPRVGLMPGEGIVVVLAERLRIRFGTMKQIFDWTLVTVSAMLSLVLLRELVGVREGTVAAAFLVGAVVKGCQWIIGRVLSGSDGQRTRSL